MREIDTLLASNESWANVLAQSDPSFLPRLAQGQSPLCLWLGCSDSRVPPDTLTASPPGTLFVHRNIANLALADDPSFRAVLHYAVAVLRVPHIVVCGHTNCGGLTAVVEGKAVGDVGHWLLAARDVYDAHRPEIGSISDPRARVNRFAELNVAAQVKTISESEPVTDAWREGRDLAVHGFMYDLATGLLRDLGVTRRAERGPAGLEAQHLQ